MARSQVAHAFFLLKSEVYHFISNLHQHMIMKANDACWNKLCEDITSTSTADLDHLRLLHEDYLASIMHHTLLGTGATAVIIALREILNLCMDLKRLHTSQLFDYIGIETLLPNRLWCDNLLSFFQSNLRREWGTRYSWLQ